MSIRITLTSAKGGTGKTTTALNLAVALAEKGHSTLLVDLDPQGAVGLSLGKSDTELIGLAEVLVRHTSLDEALLTTKLSGLTLLPRGRLDPVDVPDYEDALQSSAVLGGLLDALAERYRYVLLDTPSGLGKIPRAALATSDYALLPLQADPLALRSLSQVLRVMAHVREHENPRLELLGILPTMVRLKEDASLNVMNALWGGFTGVLETTIPRTEVFANASDKGLPVAFMAGPVSPEARRFELLAAEIDSLVAKRSGVTGEGHDRPQRTLL
jgi:chromosome partitioning protein